MNEGICRRCKVRSEEDLHNEFPTWEDAYIVCPECGKKLRDFWKALDVSKHDKSESIQEFRY